MINKNYEKVKKWREENKEKHRLQWLRRYKKNKKQILAKKREVYRLKKENENS